MSFDAITNGSIQRLITATDKSSKVMAFLSCVAIALAIVQTAATIVQVWLAFRPSPQKNITVECSCAKNNPAQKLK